MMTELATSHKMRIISEPRYRPAYGNTMEPAGQDTYLLCSCGIWRQFEDDAATAKANHLREAECQLRGYDQAGGFFVCCYDRTVTDSMDAHDRICTRPKEA